MDTAAKAPMERASDGIEEYVRANPGRRFGEIQRAVMEATGCLRGTVGTALKAMKHDGSLIATLDKEYQVSAYYWNESGMRQIHVPVGSQVKANARVPAAPVSPMAWMIHQIDLVPQCLSTRVRGR